MKCVRVAILGVCLAGACFGGELLEELKSEIAKFANVDVVIELCDLSK